MNLDAAKAQITAATDSAKQQLELNRTMVENQLDACDRILARKAADTVLTVAGAIGADPT